MFARTLAAIAVILSLAPAVVSAQETPPPVSAFARLPAIESLSLSPDGTRFAHIENRADGTFLVVRNVEDFAIVGAVDVTSVKARGAFWANDEYVILIFSETSSFAGIRGNQAEFSAPVAVNVADMSTRQLMQNRRGRGSALYITTSRANVLGVDQETGELFIPDMTEEDTVDLFAVDPRNDTYRVVDRGVRTSGGWILDSAGNPVVRSDFATRPGRPGLLQFQARRANGLWSAIYEETTEVPETSMMGLDEQGRLLIARRTPESGRYGLYPVSLESGEVGAPLILDDRYDLGSVYTDPYTNLVVGASVAAEAAEWTWFRQDLADLQAVLDSGFPGQSARPVSWSRDRDRYIVAVSSGEAPTVYYLFDKAEARMRAIQSAYPELVQTGIAPRLSIEYTARDGVKIPAYLTIADDVRQPAPLVVLPHGGPESRDADGFDWLAHFVASRGYAVLQPNFRGSEGYGLEWRDAGRGGWGVGVMQHDVSDGVDALVEAGIADPERVCIAGASYGGYAALAGAVYTPDLYRCAIAIAPVSDLNGMINYERDRRGFDSWVLDYWDDVMGGELGAASGRLNEMSPYRFAENATAPVLLIHGRDDTVVPFAQSQRMENALRSAGKDVELVELAGEDHWMSRAETRQQLLEAMDAFLQEHLPR